MTVDFIYLFRQIEFTHQCGHALVLSLFAGLLDAQEEMETRGGGGGGGESSSWSIPTSGVELAGCRAGWNIEPMDKPFLPKQSSQRVSLVFLYLFLMVSMYKCQISSVFCWDFVCMCVCVCEYRSEKEQGCCERSRDLLPNTLCMIGINHPSTLRSCSIVASP